MSNGIPVSPVVRIAILALAKSGMRPRDIHRSVAPDWPAQRVHNVLGWARRSGVAIPLHGRAKPNVSPVADRHAEILSLAAEGNSPKVIVYKLQLPVTAGCVSKFLCAARKRGAAIPHYRCYARFAEPQP